MKASVYRHSFPRDFDRAGHSCSHQMTTPPPRTFVLTSNYHPNVRGGHLMWAPMSGPVKNRMGTNVRDSKASQPWLLAVPWHCSGVCVWVFWSHLCRRPAYVWDPPPSWTCRPAWWRNSETTLPSASSPGQGWPPSTTHICFEHIILISVCDKGWTKQMTISS